MRKINEIIIHCSDSSFGNTHRIRRWHKEKGWSDIGYHYVINNGKVYTKDKLNENVEDGFIEEGRPLEKAGAHVKDHNSHSIGICLIGIDEFTDKQFQSLENLVLGLINQFNIDIKDVKGHYDYSSKSCPNFNVNSFIKNHILGGE